MINIVIQVKDLVVTGGESYKLNVFKYQKGTYNTQSFPVDDWIYSGLFVEEKDTLYIGCLGGQLHIFKVKDSQLE